MISYDFAGPVDGFMGLFRHLRGGKKKQLTLPPAGRRRWTPGEATPCCLMAKRAVNGEAGSLVGAKAKKQGTLGLPDNNKQTVSVLHALPPISSGELKMIGVSSQVLMLNILPSNHVTFVCVGLCGIYPKLAIQVLEFLHSTHPAKRLVFNSSSAGRARSCSRSEDSAPTPR